MNTGSIFPTIEVKKTGVFKEATDMEDVNVGVWKLRPQNDFTENSCGKSSKDQKTGDQNLVESIGLTYNLNLLGYDTALCNIRSENGGSTLHQTDLHL